jgi:tetratricopeptide (TPR) repeat protein
MSKVVILLNSLFTLLACGFFMVAPAQGITTDEASLKQRAAAYVTGRKLDSALYFSKKLSELYPTAGNYLLTGSVYELRNDKTNADKLYSKAIDVAGKELYKVYSDLGLVMLKRKDTAKAMSYEYASLGLFSSQPGVHYFLGGLHEVRNTVDSAHYHFTQAWLLDSTNSVYLKKMYAITYPAGNVATALRYLEKALAMDSTDKEARSTLVYGYLEVDAFDKALVLLKKQMSDTLAGNVDYFNLARCYLNLGDTANGIPALQQAIALSAAVNTTYYDELVNVLAAQGQHKNMLEVYVAGAAAGMEGYQQWLAAYGEAITEMKRIYKYMDATNTTTSLYQLGKLYLSVQDYTNSLKVLQDYQTAGGQPSDSLFSLLAVGYLSLNHYAQAREAIDKALVISPGNEDYQLLLLSILYRMKDYKEVIAAIDGTQVLQQKGKKDGDAPLRRYLLFKSHWALGHVKEAALYHAASF